MEILRVEDVGHKYQAENGEVTAFEHISFTVQKGEFMSIVGPSGCGKSTLLSIIAGLLQFGIYSLLVKAVSGFSYVQLITLLPYRQLALLVSLAYLGIGLLVGVFGSLITIRKFLRV